MNEGEQLAGGETVRPNEVRRGAERDELDARFERLRPRLVALARSLATHDEAEDVVHDAYLLAQRNLDRLRDPAALEGWLSRIVVNRAFELHRRRIRLDRLLPRPAAAQATRDLGLRELIERLPARSRVVVVLHYGHGYALGEIAALLDLTPTNVRAIISRARRSLYAAWREAER